MVWWRKAGEAHLTPLVLMWEQRRREGMESSLVLGARCEDVGAGHRVESRKLKVERQNQRQSQKPYPCRQRRGDKGRAQDLERTARETAVRLGTAAVLSLYFQDSKL